VSKLREGDLERGLRVAAEASRAEIPRGWRYRYLSWELRVLDSVASSLDLFGILIINIREIMLRFSMHFQKFIQLCMDGLCVAVFGSLNKQCHGPGRQRCD
jgi:hypothetical protein